MGGCRFKERAKTALLLLRVILLWSADLVPALKGLRSACTVYKHSYLEFADMPDPWLPPVPSVRARHGRHPLLGMPLRTALAPGFSWAVARRG